MTSVHENFFLFLLINRTLCTTVPVQERDYDKDLFDGRVERIPVPVLLLLLKIGSWWNKNRTDWK